MGYYKKTSMLRVLLSVLLANLVRISVLSDDLPLNLRNGTDKCSGTVEIFNGTWGTICDEHWDINDATVVCKQLKCGEAVSAPRKACFGQGSGPILHQVKCSGTERSLSLCKLSGFKTTSCSHDQDAGVVCKGSGLLHPPNISCPNPAVRPGENIQITCTTPKLCTTMQLYRDGTKINMPKSSVFNLSNMESSKQGQYSCRYSIEGTDMTSPPSRNITIIVVTLKQPSIFLSSEEDTLCPPNPHRSTESQPVEVTKGHSFSIICCTVSQYEGGSFQLLINGTKPEPMLYTSANRTSIEQPHHLSASFLFPEADDSHQGNYTCVYEVTVGGRLFHSSQSDPLRVTVKDSWLLLFLLVGGGLLLLSILLLTICLAWRYRRDKRHRKSSISDHGYITGPEGGETYRRHEPVEDDERDYQSMDEDEDKEDYVNTATLECKRGSLGDEEDYINTETLGNREESLAEEGDYVNTETLGDGVGDYECMEKHSVHSDGDDYVNVDPVSGVIN